MRLELTTLQRLRAERDMTVRELAKRAKVDPSTLVALENGHRKARVTTLARLAKVLKVPLDSLVDEYLDTTGSERGKKGWKTRLDQSGEGKKP
jgi:transcriptional regulator with XRE-family HTH domain